MKEFDPRTDKDKLFQSLDNALENGYELLDWPTRKIAEDLNEYDADFEDVDPEELEPLIDEWRKGHE